MLLQREVSQNEKIKDGILMHICRIGKNIGIDNLIYKAEIKTQMQRTCGYQGGSGVNWEIGMTYER